MGAVLFCTVFVDLVTAVAVGMIMASFLFMQRMVDLQIGSITTLTEPHEESNLSEEESAILTEANGRILLFQITGPMSFGAAKGTARRLASFDAYDALIIDLSEVPQIDYTSTRAIDDMLHSAWDSGRDAFVVGCRQQVCNMLQKQGITHRISQDELKQSRLESMKTALAHIKERQSA